MEIVRTTKTRLDWDVAAAKRTVEAWSAACNDISQQAFAQGCLSNTVRLHRLVYRDIRTRFGLSAQVAQNAIRHVASKYAGARIKKIQLKRPVTFSKQCAVALQGGERGRDFGFRHKGVSLWTVDGRIKGLPFHGEPRLCEYLSEWKMGDGRLFIGKGKVYLSISFKREVETVFKPNDAVVGVDRGIRVLATVTDGQRQLFFGGGHTHHVRNRYAKTRASLQKKKARTGSRSTRRTLKRLSGRERRFMRNDNHVMSRRIVDFSRDTGNPTIAVEDLGGIRNGRKLRKQQRTDLNRWAFYELEQFIRYKADTFGMEVIGVDPKYTSQGCSRCGHTEKDNRHQHRFLCKACGYELHADLNASRNIRLRGILARQVLCEDGSLSCGPEARLVDPGSKPGEGAGKPSALAVTVHD
ncbi:transposase [Nitrosococcus oceani ATCC 19707]|uniref:Transposase n=2 Tax=Nitrosococcus oceani TaxID=1229 RepID=Q3JBU5_NITOC|nr:RNA-guided endonuclease TnpB family protein [Nitrosococcus oceani]ABA57701.1 transposase [Nitrosococcus oceani ATCC 19707]EDZ67785.1 Putative transposase DNA-binding domain family [Nitrosococcus oceani AFC27]KFI19870.1 transposase [Nitrosococcus oceani C-27]GEM19351.1 transposase [Nitrosococcus oceani]